MMNTHHGPDIQHDKQTLLHEDSHVQETPSPSDLSKSTSTSTAIAVPAVQQHVHHLPAPSISHQFRPLSPDATSNLSIEEYTRFHPSTSHYEPPDLTEKELADETSPRKAKLKAFWVRNLGLLYMLVAMLFGSLMSVTTRKLEIEGGGGKGFHPFQILFARMSITVLLAMLYMWYTRTPHFPFGPREVRLLLIARGMGGFFGVFGLYYSLLYLPMADATVITFLAPSLTCWACSFLIKEPFTRVEKICSLVAFVGVIFIARPTSFFSFSSSSPSESVPPTNTTQSHVPDASNYDNVTPTQRLAGVGVALVGVFGSVCAYTTIRWIGKRAHPLISVNYFAVWCTIVSTVALLTLPGVGFLLPANAREWGLLIFLGACGFIMQFLLSAGLSYEKSSRTTNMTYTSMLFALTFDKFMFGQTPGIWSIVGSTLILGSAVWMAVKRDGGSSSSSSSAKDVNEDSARADVSGGNEEEGVGLMAAMEGGEVETGRDMAARDVEMRRLG